MKQVQRVAKRDARMRGHHIMAKTAVPKIQISESSFFPNV